MQWLLLFAGGGLGAVLRYALSLFVQARAGGGADGAFPWGILAVNLIGCFAIGALVTAGEEHHSLGPPAREFLVVGLLGGFTTFSAFGFDTWQLVRDGAGGAALLNVVGNVVGGLLAVVAGAGAARALG